MKVLQRSQLSHLRGQSDTWLIIQRSPQGDVLKNWKCLSAKRFPIRDSGRQVKWAPGKVVLEMMRDNETIYVCAQSRVSFPPPTRGVFFFFFLPLFNAVISCASPPANASHGSSPHLSLWTAAHSFFPPLSLVLVPPLPSGIFQFQIITPRYIHSLSFIPPLCSSFLEALWPTGIKAFQLHLQTQNKNNAAGFCSSQWWKKTTPHWGFILESCNTINYNLKV